MTSQFWIGGGHCWESWGIPRPGVHVLFWWPCPHGRRLTTGQSRGGDRPLLSSQSISAGQLQPLWHGPGGQSFQPLCLALSEKKWIAVNIERARLFVCFLWGPVAPGRSLRGNRSTWLSAGGSQVAAILPPCTTPLAPPPMFPKQCPPRLSSRQIFGKRCHCRLQPEVELFVCKNNQAAFAADTWTNYNAFPFHGLHFQNIKSRSWQRCQFESFLRLSHLDQ